MSDRDYDTEKASSNIIKLNDFDPRESFASNEVTESNFTTRGRDSEFTSTRNLQGRFEEQKGSTGQLESQKYLFS